MTLAPHFNRLATFLAHLDCLDTSAQTDAFINEAIETGGNYLAPDPAAGIHNHVQISLHGVTVHARTEAEAVRWWKRAAGLRLADTEDDGMITVFPPLPRLGEAAP